MHSAKKLPAELQQIADQALSSFYRANADQIALVNYFKGAWALKIPEFMLLYTQRIASLELAS